MRLTFASYNIHKGIGVDGRRDPERTLEVINQLEADIVGLQEVDRRLGQRASVLDRARLEECGWQLASMPHKPASLGWHGNVILVKAGLAIEEVSRVNLPQLEPRGALQASVLAQGQRLSVTSMHLDLSGLRRRAQLERLCYFGRATGLPAVMLGDLNEWSQLGGGLRGLAKHWSIMTPGRTFPARRPLLSLDRVIHSPHWQCRSISVFDTELARKASDHLPIRAELDLTA